MVLIYRVVARKQEGAELKLSGEVLEETGYTLAVTNPRMYDVLLQEDQLRCASYRSLL